MANDVNIIERAFELARSGTIADMGGLRAQLKLERHEGVDAHLGSSPSLNRQLVLLLRQSKQGACA